MAKPVNIHRPSTSPIALPLARRARGFTLIELLLVMGIISILMSILLPVVKSISNQAKQRQTRATMLNLVAMLQEAKAADNLASIYNLASPTPIPSVPMNAPINVNVGGSDRNGPMVQYTRAVMNLLIALPQNKQAFQRIAGTSIYADNIYSSVNGSVIIGNGPVLLDGWGNPIIFVPHGGMNVVTQLRVAQLVVSSKSGNTGDATNREFFASAGPDGFFTNPNSPPAVTSPDGTGSDDNLYSFDH